MSHIENLIMNEIRKALESLEKNGVGFINYENTGNICYNVDDTQIMVNVRTIKESV